MPLPTDLFAEMKQKADGDDGGAAAAAAPKNAMLAQMLAAKAKGPPKTTTAPIPATPTPSPTKTTATNTTTTLDFGGKAFVYDKPTESFIMAAHSSKKQDANHSLLTVPLLIADVHGNEKTDISVPLAPCVCRMTDYTYAKKEAIQLKRCVLKLGVLRCLQRECTNLNTLLWNRFNPPGMEHTNNPEDAEHSQHAAGSSFVVQSMEEDELGKARFMELLSNCGVFQRVSELILTQVGKAVDLVKQNKRTGNSNNPFRIPQVHVDGLDEFLATLETLVPALQESRNEIQTTQSVCFYPGLGELFTPGSKLTCFPEGMEGTPLGCQVVQCWYDEELNKATNQMKRRFILVIEFIVSVGEELVFVAASDVYPEFHDPSRSIPIKDLTHRRLLPDQNPEDAILLQRLQSRGEFYASVATKNHYLEYHPNSFYPIIGGGWSNNAVRPLSKGGRVMVDVKRGIVEGHIPVRGSADGMSDTVKEAIKLFDQSKRTGVAVPFRTCILPGFDGFAWMKEEQGDRQNLWQAWPMLTGFSFTARVWGKLLLGMPKSEQAKAGRPLIGRGDLANAKDMVRRQSIKKFGGAITIGALGGVGKCGNCGYIKFQEQAFDQLVLAEDKKELIRAVARNAGGGTKLHEFDEDDSSEDEDDDDDDIGIDVVANKGGASIFLLHGPPGTGKTLTAEAIAELLRKPLYVVTAGDLGITAAEVEKTLGSVLELCQTWDALVLIDEADVFLEARNSHEIQRNALVCVMLRLLEYYSGCLFLSSNRSANSIDAAIASRITVMLGYPQLDLAGRGKVWKNLVELIPVVPESMSQNSRKASKYRMEFLQEDYESLAKGYNLNGRQIKNSIVLARALARERGSPLSMSIIQRAVTAVAGEDAKIPDSENGY